MYFSPINKTPWALKQAQSMIHPICDPREGTKHRQNMRKLRKKRHLLHIEGGRAMAYTCNLISCAHNANKIWRRKPTSLKSGSWFLYHQCS